MNPLDKYLLRLPPPSFNIKAKHSQKAAVLTVGTAPSFIISSNRAVIHNHAAAIPYNPLLLITDDNRRPVIQDNIYGIDQMLPVIIAESVRNLSGCNRILDIKGTIAETNQFL